MKQYRLQEALLRTLSTMLGAFALHIGYMFLSPWTAAPNIPFAYIFVTALLGLAINIYEPKCIKTNARSIIIIAVGIIISALAAILFSRGFNVIEILLIFVLFLLVWNRAAKYFYIDMEFLYTIGQFYFNMGLLLVLNTFTAYSQQFSYLKSDIGRYTIIYTVAAIFLLIEIRNIKFLKNTEKKKSILDIIFILSILTATFALSTQKALEIISSIIKAVYGFINPIVAAVVTTISAPFVYVLNLLFSRLKLLVGKAFEKLTGAAENIEKLNPEKYQELTGNSSPVFDYVMKFITSGIIIILVLLVIYFLYIYIDKAVRKKSKGSYEEDREFVVDVGINRLSKLTGKAVNKLTDVYKMAAFSITADTREKLRHEYKTFLQKLYAKKAINAENITAWEVYEVLNPNYPAIDKVLKDITKLYEEVRYGEKLPQRDELKAFKIKVKDILKAIN